MLKDIIYQNKSKQIKTITNIKQQQQIDSKNLLTKQHNIVESLI
jgi:hypothetical protein